MMDTIFEPYAVRLEFNTTSPLNGEAWRNLLLALMDRLARRITDSGSVVIGHLKGFAQAPELGFMKVSAVSADHPADAVGEFTGLSNGLALTINVLVYGKSRDELEELTRRVIELPNEPWSGLAVVAPLDR